MRPSQGMTTLIECAQHDFKIIYFPKSSELLFIATYPSAGVRKGQDDRPKRLSPREKTSGVATNVYSRKTLEKPKDQGLQILKMRVRELFTHEEGISTPRACHKGRQPLIECAKHDFKIMYFPFFMFFTFSGWQGYCPCSYVSSGAMRKSDLRSSLQFEILCVTLILIANKSHLRHSDLRSLRVAKLRDRRRRSICWINIVYLFATYVVCNDLPHR